MSENTLKIPNFPSVARLDWSIEGLWFIWSEPETPRLLRHQVSEQQMEEGAEKEHLQRFNQNANYFKQWTHSRGLHGSTCLDLIWNRPVANPPKPDVHKLFSKLKIWFEKSPEDSRPKQIQKQREDKRWQQHYVNQVSSLFRSTILDYHYYIITIVISVAASVSLYWTTWIYYHHSKSREQIYFPQM